MPQPQDGDITAYGIAKKMWIMDIDDLLNSSHSAPRKQSEQIVGRLNHAACAFPIARHFLASIHSAQYRATKSRYTTMSADVKPTPRLWKLLLKHIHSGASLT